MGSEVPHCSPTPSAAGGRGHDDVDESRPRASGEKKVAAIAESRITAATRTVDESS